VRQLQDKLYGVVVMCWMMNDVMTADYEIKKEIPSETREAMSALGTWLKAHAKVAIMVIGRSAQVWGLDPAFDRYAEYARNYFTGLQFIKVYDGISAYGDVTHCRWHVASDPKSKAKMALFYTSIITDALG
jgi:hypothetical protein